MNEETNSAQRNGATEIDRLREEVARLRARVAQLEADKAELIRVSLARDFERPPHYQ